MNQNNTIDTNLLRQIFFIAIILFLGIVLFRELWYFLSAFLGSVTFYVIMRGRMFYLSEKKGWKKGTAATVLMLLSFFVILLPLGLLANILYEKVSYLVSHSSELINSLKIFAVQLREKVGFQFIDPNAVNQLGPFLGQLLPKVLGVTVNTITSIASMYFILYFMLVNGRTMETALYEYLPLQHTNVELIGKELRTNVVANTIGIPLIAIVQGIVALIGYLILGVSEPWVWFVATCVASMLPVLGAAIIYVPLSIMFLVQGNIGKGVALLLWGALLVGLVDNLFRFLLNKKLGDIHPLITVFGVIIGVQLFGFIGLVFGPLLISMFILLLRIYSSEFLVKKRIINQ
jgi:predicted PurR-regulated permease PerM